MSLIQKGVTVSLDPLAVRITFLSVSMVAFVMYSYYCSDLTAKMTHRPPPVQIRSFQVGFFKYKKIQISTKLCVPARRTTNVVTCTRNCV